MSGLLLTALAALAAAQAPDSAPRPRALARLSSGHAAEAARIADPATLPALHGEALVLLGRWEDAEPVLRRAASGGDPDSLSAAFALARLAEWRGRRAEARQGYERLVDAYHAGSARTARDLVAVANALERLSVTEPDAARDALRLYDLAARRDPADPEPRLRAAELLLARYNPAESRTTFDSVRRRAPRHPRLLLGTAQIHRLLGDGDPMPAAESSLSASPDFAPARVFLARLALEADDWDGAARQLARALAADPRSREAWAVRGALAWMRGDSAGMATADSAVRAADPAAADHLVASADAAARARRYAEAVTLAERAVARDSLAWRGWATLGANRLRRGDMRGGRAALERAFAGDPFDLWTKNTLDLLDTLERFPSTASPRFRFVMDGRESELLALYVAPLAEEAYQRLAARYGIEPAAPIRVEIYPSHADFSVRTVGLAGIGALGVCFGPVIAMDSPSARDRGQFNWGSTLWHEIAHVFHLELSRSRVPRWLTEGLAVLEERRARPGWGDEADPGFLTAWRERALPPLSRLNEGFLRPRTAAALGQAYLLASYGAEWIESRWGAAAPGRLLRGYGEGLDSRTVVRQVLNLSLDSLDTAFAAWFDARFAARLGTLGPGGLAAALTAGQTALGAGRAPEARAAFERARTLFPEHVGPDNPYRPLVRLALERGDRAGAAADLAALLAHDETAYDAALQLAGLLEALGRPDEALAALERALFVSPLDPALHERLAAHYERVGRPEDLVRERHAALALRPTDRGGAWYRLARALVAAGRLADARRAVVRALEAAPGYADAQDLLLDLAERRP